MKTMRSCLSSISRAVVLAFGLLSCSPVPVTRTPVPCSPTPVTELVLSDGSKWGQRGGDVFFQTANAPPFPPLRLQASPTLNKVLVILANPLPPPAPNDIQVRGRELSTGRTATFTLIQTLTTDVPYGAQWGTNFSFPQPGCWELTVDVPGDRGTIVAEVD